MRSPVKLKKPGVANKEGLQISGVYLLVIVGVLQMVFPEVEPQDIQEVADWWQRQGFDYRKIWSFVVDGGLIAYVANRLREK